MHMEQRCHSTHFSLELTSFSSSLVRERERRGGGGDGWF